MGRNRVIYQSEALFVKDMDHHASLARGDQLLRVQDISHGVELARTDVNEFGQLAAIERKIIEAPTVSLEFSYYVHGGRNEGLIGFKPTDERSAGGAAALVQSAGGFLKNDSGKNYYISVAGEGEDASGKSGAALEGAIGIGNGFLTNYSVEAAVGDMPSASVSVEASNLRFHSSGNSIPNPGVKTDSGAIWNSDTVDIPSALDTGTKDGTHNVACVKPGDILVDFNDAGNHAPSSVDKDSEDKVLSLGGARLEGDGQMHLQNFTLDLPLARTALTRLGSKFPYAREVETPVSATFTCSAFLGDIEEGNLADLLCDDSGERNIRVKMLTECQGNELVQEFLLKGCSLDSQNFSASIGDNKTVDLVWTCQLGGASDTDKGLFMWFAEDSAGVDHDTSGDSATYNP